MLNWLALEGPWITPPHAVRLDEERLAVFTCDTDHSVRLRWRTGGAWSDWESLAGAAIASPFVISNGEDGLDLFSVGHEHLIWHRRWHDGIWDPWVSLEGQAGGATPAAPHAVWSTPDRLDLFVLGTNLVVWHRHRQHGRWSEWVRHSDLMLSPPFAVSRGQGQIDLVVIGADSQLYHSTSSEGAWSGWRGVADDPAIGVPCVGVTGRDRVEVFTLGEDRGVNLYTWDRNWRDVVHLHGTAAASPRAIGGPDGRLDLFVVGEDSAIWHRGRRGPDAGWSAWRSLGGEAFSPPSLVGYPDRIELYVLDRHSAIAYATFPLDDAEDGALSP